jgi:Concanavalin A-like lectin/glucanases superfamily
VQYLQFDGTSSYFEVPDSPLFSVDTSGALTVAAWMRPDTLIFPVTEGSGYVYWLGKGQAEEQEWTFRMYSQDNTEGRENRISFYVFNPPGGRGIGSYFQDPLEAGQWIHVVGVADGERTHIYRDGRLRKSDVYSGSIAPRHGSAPLRMGTRDLASFFQGALSQVRVWNRALSESDVASLYGNTVPPDGLVAEYLFDITRDTVGGNDGAAVGVTWGFDPVGGASVAAEAPTLASSGT